MTASLLCAGVRCAACGWLIESCISNQPGVVSIAVDPVTARTELVWKPEEVQLSEILAQLAQLGYTPHPYTEDASERAAVKERRQSLRRLIVAGLGMMQVMSFAVAMYAGALQGIDPEIEDFLRIISLLVATPIVFYAGAPFFARAWHGLCARRLGMDVPVSLAIGCAYLASTWNTFIGSGPVFFDSATMFVFFLSAARHLEMSGRHRALNLTGALACHLPQIATRMIAGAPETVGVMELNIGDQVRIQPGGALPVDGILLTESARVDEAVLTGESDPVMKKIGDTMVAGSINQYNAIVIEVSRIGAATMMAQIGRLITDARDHKPKFVQLADRIASFFVGGVLIAATIAGTFWFSHEPARAFEIVLAILVVTCPCALALATPAAYSVATSSLAARGFLIRKVDALQTLSQITDAIFDKTGTLTLHEGGSLRTHTLVDIPDDEAIELASILEAESEHPLARIFSQPRNAARGTGIRAVPGSGVEGHIDGQRYRIGSLAFATEPLGEEAPRVVPDLDRPVFFLANQTRLIAQFSVAETVRPGSSGLIADLSAAGITTTILSGDRDGPVRAVAQALDISSVYSTKSPQAKLELIKRFQQEGRIVAMIGDGINDSPVLAGADVSIALGSGTSLAQYSADCLLLGTSLDTLRIAIEQARKTSTVVRQNLAWAIGYNLIALPLAATGMLAPWMAAIGMSASSLIVTTNAWRLSRIRQVRPEKPNTAACCSKMAKASG